MPCADPGAQIGPLAGVGRVRPVVGLPLVVEDDDSGHDALLLEQVEELVVIRLCGVVGRDPVVRFRDAALGSPAAEDRLAPPRRLVARLRRGSGAAGNQVVAMATEARVWIARARGEQEYRCLENPCDAPLTFVLEPKPEAAVPRLVDELDEVELVQGRDDREVEPRRCGGDRDRLRTQSEVERRRSEEPVASPGFAVARDSEYARLGGRPKNTRIRRVR